MLTEPVVDIRALKQQTFGKRWLYEKIDKLEMDLYLLKKMEPYAAITYIRNGIGYEEYLAEYASFRRMNPDDLTEILDQIQESAKDYHTTEEWFSYIEDYGEELKKQMEAGRRNDKEGVTLTTMHSAKGLEYEVVFVMDVNEGVTPHKKAVKEADLEEERRLTYVAVTRAKEKLLLICGLSRGVRELQRLAGMTLSDFRIHRAVLAPLGQVTCRGIQISA